MSLKLRDLIRQVRACKTAAEERAVIAKESAMIRTCIRDEKDQYRHRNVAKLLFMHMLGYPTHFGQLECLKLVASPHFPEKRIGYLGLLLLLSEEADVLMLVTNSLKNDLNSSNKFVVGLALCGIGNLGTPDMSRDLATEVEKHLKSSNPYLRKKACLAMSRCLVKVPEMVEDFTEKFVTLLKDRSHGVLITVVQLMTQVMLLELNQEEYDENNYGPARKAFSKLVPTLVKLQRNLLSSGYSPEHDVNGISDPFLQVQILTLLRLLGTNDQETSDEMSDILAQVTTNTETSKNAGNAILYECVKTIMSVESEDSLRTLAINILGRFLLNRDNNIRYVALNTLAQVVGQDPTALQKHRSTIVDCLKDPDISIRQRALELVYHLVNSENVELLTAELLNYLVICSDDHRSEICSRVLKVVDRFAPDDRWRIDTLITMLSIAGKQCKRDVRSATIAYVSQSSDDIRSYAVHKLLKAIRDDDGSQTSLLIVGIWCIGEYGDLLLNPYTYTIPPKADENGNFSDSITITFEAIEANLIVNSIENVVIRPICPEIVTQPALTAFAKLSTRLANYPDVCDKLQKLLKKYKGSQSVETQMRSCEYDILIRLTGSKEALARMPAVDLEVMQRNQKLVDAFVPVRTKKESTTDIGTIKVNGTSSNIAESGLLDLDDIFGSTPAITSQNQMHIAQPEEKVPKTALQSDVDLLSDIFSAPPVPAPSSLQTPADLFSAQPIVQNSLPTSTTVANPLDMYAQPSISVPASTSNSIDIFGSQTPLASQVPTLNSTPLTLNSLDTSNSLLGSSPNSNITTIPVLDKDGLMLEFECSKPEPTLLGKSKVVAKFTNKSGDTIVGMNLQCAVPKYVTMEMKPPSSTTIPPSATATKVTQDVVVTNTMLGNKSLMMKVKLAFTINGTKFEHMATCSSFPSGY